MRVRFEEREAERRLVGAVVIDVAVAPAEPIAVRTRSQHEVEDALGTASHREHREDLVGVATVQRVRRVADRVGDEAR